MVTAEVTVYGWNTKTGVEVFCCILKSEIKDQKKKDSKQSFVSKKVTECRFLKFYTLKSDLLTYIQILGYIYVTFAKSTWKTVT